MEAVKNLVARMLREGKKGREIIGALGSDRHLWISLQAVQLVEILNSFGFWAQVLPYDDFNMAIHTTNRPMAEREDSLALLEKFGPRALPFFKWWDYKPQVVVEKVEEVDRFNPPPLTEEDIAEIYASLAGYDTRRQAFSGKFLWVAERFNDRGPLELLDLTKPSSVKIAFDHDIDGIELIGFDEEGGILLSGWQAFTCEKSAWTFALPSGHRFYIAESSDYDYEMEEVISGTVQIFFRPKQ